MDDPRITLEETAYKLAFEDRQKISERDRKFNEIIQGDDSLRYVTRQILNISAQKLIQEELDSDQPVTGKKALEEKYFDHLDREILGFINKHIAEILEVKIDEYWQIVTGIEIKEKGAWKELCKLARMKDRKERKFKDRISGKLKLNNTAKLMLTALYGEEYQVNPKEKQLEYTEYSFSEDILPGISSLASEEISELLSEEAIAKFKVKVLGVDSISVQSTVNEAIEKATKAIKGRSYDDAYEALEGSSESLLSKALDLRRGMSRDTDRIEIERYEVEKKHEKIQKNKLEERQIKSEIEILEDNKKQLERELQKLHKKREHWETLIMVPLEESENEKSKEYMKDVILVDYDQRIQKKETEIAKKERQIAPLSARAMEYRNRLKMLEDKEGEELEKKHQDLKENLIRELEELEKKHQDLKENLIRELEKIENAAMEIESKLQKLEKQQMRLPALYGLYGLSSEQEEQSKSGFGEAIRADIKHTQESVAELEKQYLTEDKRELLAIKRLEKQVTNILALAKQKTPQELSANLGVLDKQICQLLDSIKIAYNIDTQKFILSLGCSEEHQAAIGSLLETRNMAGVPLMNTEHNALNAVKLAIFCGIDALKENGLLPKPSWIEKIKNFLINLAIKFEFKSRPELAHSVSLGEVSYLDSEILSQMLGLKQTHAEHPDKEQQNDPAEEAKPVSDTQKMHSDSETPPEKSWTERMRSSKEMHNTNKSDLLPH